MRSRNLQECEHITFGAPFTAELEGLTGTHMLLPLEREEHSPRNPEDADRT